MSVVRTPLVFAAGAAAAVLVQRLWTWFGPRRRLSLLDLAPIVANMATSKTVAIFSQTSDMKSRGETVNAALCVGQPDFPPPAAALAATAEATELGLTAYTAVSGTLELRRAICKYLKDLKGTEYEVDQVMVACGGKQAIYEVVLATCQEGDEVVIPAPYYTSHPDIVSLSGAAPVILPTLAADDYVPTVAGLEAVLTPRTRMLILCNPCNPSGTVIGAAQLEALAAVLRRPEHAHVLVLADEIYSEITYDVPHVSFAALPGMMERTLTINGFSKSHAMTGYRLGYLAGPKPLVKAATRLQGQITSCASSIAQHAGIAALEAWPNAAPGSELHAHVAELRQKRDLALGLLRQIPALTCPTPQGAFYLLPDVSAYFGKATPEGVRIGSAEALCMALLDKYKVALVPGEAFGAPATVRLSYAATRAHISDAVAKLAQFLGELN